MNPENPQTSILDLVKASSKSKDTREARFDYGNGVFFQMKYLPKAKLQALTKSVTTRVMNPKTHMHEDHVEPRKFLDAIVKSCVFGWEGLTPKNLLFFLPSFDLAGFPEEKLDEEIPFSHELLMRMLDESYELDRWIQDTITRIECFYPDLEDESKNSKSSQSGS